MNGREGERARRRQLKPSLLFVLLVAIFVMAVGAVALPIMHSNGVNAHQAQRLEALSAKVAELTRIEQAVASKMAAGETPTAKAAPDEATPAGQSAVPLKLTSSERGFGVSLAVVRFRRVGGRTRAGWPVRLQSGNYLDGDVAFSMATSQGAIFNGSYYVDAGRTQDGTLLRDAPVIAYGWASRRAGTRSSVSARIFVRVIKRPGRRGAKWRDAWFWVKISREGKVLAATQIQPR